MTSETVLAPIPLTAGEVRRWVGSDFCSLKYGREDQIPDENDIYAMSAHDIISAFINMGEIWPIAKLVVDGKSVTATLFAPGLPDGEHEVYPVPMMSDAAAEQVRVAIEQERERCAAIVAGALNLDERSVNWSETDRVLDDVLRNLANDIRQGL